MKKIPLYTTVLLALILGFGFSLNQDAQEDVERFMIQNIAEAKNDSLKVIEITNLGKYYLNSGDFDRAQSTLTEAITTAKEIGYSEGEAEAMKYVAINFYMNRGNFDEALNYSREALDIYKRLGDSVGIANIESNIGGFFKGVESPQAIEYYISSLRIAEKVKDTFRIATVLNNLGGLYGDYMQQPEKAKEYLDQAQVYFQAGFEGAENLKGTFMANLAECNLINANYEEALEEYLELLENDKGTNYHAETLRKVGQSYFGLNQFQEAEIHFKQSVEIAEQQKNYIDWIKGLTVLGNFYTARSNPVQALPYLNQALELSEELGLIAEKRDVFFELYRAYEEMGQNSMALDNHKKYLYLKDSLFNIKAVDQVRYAQLNYNLERQQNQIQLLERETEITELEQKKQKSVNIATAAVAGLLLILAVGLFNRYKFIKKANNIINEEKERSDNLLLNILPEETAQELKENGRVAAKSFESVTVMFTDFVGFTQSSETMNPEELVENVDHFFSKFDEIIDRYGLEKIKTIGDAYMCAGGLPFPIENHAQKMLLAALDMLEFVREVVDNPDDGIPGFEVRVGIHTGPVVAGVVGTKKFAYDIWGDTVNVASRMESTSEAGRINISETTYALVKDDFDCSYRGEVEAKNKGMLKMYYVNQIKDTAASSAILRQVKAG